MTNWYCGLSTLRDSLGIASTDTADDDQLGPSIEAVSRAIDEHCGRWFYPRVQTRYFTPLRGSELLLDADLLSVTSLKADEDDDRTYEVTWATTDYDLGPDNALLGSVARPYWRIDTAPNGARSFPTGRKSVELVGSWGFYDQRTTSTATVSGALNSSAVSVNVSSGAAFEVGQTILVDSEQMFVSAISSNTLTVERGVNGTTAATHANGAAIQVYEYPVIGRLALLQAAHLFRIKDAPGGLIGSAELGVQRVAPNFHPMVYRQLDPFRLRIVA